MKLIGTFILSLLYICISIKDAESARADCVKLSRRNADGIIELSELSQKLSKFLRLNLDYDQLSSAFADVEYDVYMDDESSFTTHIVKYQNILHSQTTNLIEKEIENAKSFFQNKTEESEKRIIEHIQGFINQAEERINRKSQDFLKKIMKIPTDCQEVFDNGQRQSIVYEIFPPRFNHPIKALCDMETDGGWTVFLKRDASGLHAENFERNWKDYKNGFGSRLLEHWLGNEALHALTTAKNYTLRIEASNKFGSIWGEWDLFRINSEQQMYKLNVGKYNNNSTMAKLLYLHNNENFTTIDRDNDSFEGSNCADDYKGGFWYQSCINLIPTGEHGKLFFAHWSTTDHETRSANKIEMKIRPTQI